MAGNLTFLRGSCPPPFLEFNRFPLDGGNVALRLCAPVPQLKNLTCCLPCPFTDWIYPPSFQVWYRVAESLSVVGLFVCALLIITWIVLPPEKTHRHYLNICLVVAVIVESLAFVVPLIVRPPQCYNEITPNDMFTSLTCAFSGAFVVAGALSTTIWIFIRALSMHLQVCWNITPGQKFFYVAQAGGWGIVGVFFVLTMTFTGVSFRFGDACHINSAHSLRDFWGPLLAITAAAALVQLLTFGYCMKVYLENMWSDDKTETSNSTGLPSYNSSVRTQTAKVVYQRVKKVLWLQWRSITIILFLILDIFFFSIVWVRLDKTIEDAMEGRIEEMQPFLTCLFHSGGDRTKCYKTGQQTLVNQQTVTAILILLSLTGIQTGLMMSRTAMWTGWAEFLRRRTSKRREFVSLDAKRYQSDTRTMELHKVGPPSVVVEKPISEDLEHQGPPRHSLDLDDTNKEHGYRLPVSSSSGPLSPSVNNRHSDWYPPSMRALSSSEKRT